MLVSRATCYAKLLEEPLAGSASADTNLLASVLFRDRGTFHYQTNGEVLREPPSQQEQYAQVGLILEVLQAAREHAGVTEGSLDEHEKTLAAEWLQQQWLDWWCTNDALRHRIHRLLQDETLSRQEKRHTEPEAWRV